MTCRTFEEYFRPYQESGFQWLNYLSEVKWGGILADDMGLGKTVQALSFMQHYKERTWKIEGIGGLSNNAYVITGKMKLKNSRHHLHIIFIMALQDQEIKRNLQVMILSLLPMALCAVI